MSDINKISKLQRLMHGDLSHIFLQFVFSALMLHALTPTQANSLPIDDWRTSQTVVSNLAGRSQSNVASNAKSLGGYRKIVAILKSGVSFGALTFQKDSKNYFAATPFSGSSGVAEIDWYGSSAVSPTSAAMSINLAPNQETSFKVKIDRYVHNPAAPTTIRIIYFDSRNNPYFTKFSTKTITLTRNYSNESINVPFSSFIQSGGGASINYVGRLKIEFSGSAEIRIRCIETTDGKTSYCDSLDSAPILCGSGGGVMGSLSGYGCITPAPQATSASMPTSPTALAYSATTSPTPAKTPSRTRTATASPSRTPSKTPTRAATPTRTKAATATAMPSRTPTKIPTKAATPTRTKAAIATAVASKTPTRAPTRAATPIPTRIPTAAPTFTRTPTPVPAIPAGPAHTPVPAPFRNPAVKEFPEAEFSVVTSETEESYTCTHPAELYTISKGHVIRSPAVLHAEGELPDWKLDLGEHEIDGKTLSAARLHYGRISASKNTLWLLVQYTTKTNNPMYYAFGMVKVDISNLVEPRLLTQSLGPTRSLKSGELLANTVPETFFPLYQDFFDDHGVYRMRHSASKSRQSCVPAGHCPFLDTYDVTRKRWNEQEITLPVTNGVPWSIIKTDPQSWPYVLLSNVSTEVFTPDTSSSEYLCGKSGALISRKVEVSLGKIGSGGRLAVQKNLETRKYESKPFTITTWRKNTPGFPEVNYCGAPDVYTNEQGCFRAGPNATTRDLLYVSENPMTDYVSLAPKLDPMQHTFLATNFSYNHKTKISTYAVNLLPSFSLSFEPQYIDKCGYITCRQECAVAALNEGGFTRVQFGGGCSEYRWVKEDRQCFKFLKGVKANINIEGVGTHTYSYDVDPEQAACEETIDGVKQQTCPVGYSPFGRGSSVLLAKVLPTRVFSIPIDGKKVHNLEDAPGVSTLYATADGKYLGTRNFDLVLYSSSGNVIWTKKGMAGVLSPINYFLESDPSIFYLTGINGNYPASFIKFLPDSLIKRIYLEPNLATRDLTAIRETDQVKVPAIASTRNEFFIPYYKQGTGATTDKATPQSCLRCPVETRAEDPYAATKEHLSLTATCQGGICTGN